MNKFVRRAIKRLPFVPSLYGWYRKAIKRLPFVPSFRLWTGALSEYGWYRSYRSGRGVGRQGEPIPRIAYAALEFLLSRVRPDMRVFEFGSGSSTHWWAARVREVVSVEHDRRWFARVEKGLPSNVELIFADLNDGSYAESVVRSGSLYDIIVIDGLDRNRCAGFALSALEPDGVVMWDDTQTDEYREGIENLLTQGFKMIEFVSIGPMHAYNHPTGILYRDENCLGI